MLEFNPKSIYYMAKKEFLDKIRNKWIIILTILYVVLIVLFAFYAGTSNEETFFGDIEATVLITSGFTSFIIPLIAIILGFSTISGEDENGALSIVLSHPITRLEILIGKYLGLGLVIIISILSGFGIGGILIAASGGSGSAVQYLQFIFVAILYGFVYLSLSIFASTLCKTKVKSILSGLFILFYSIIASIILIVIYFITDSSAYDTSSQIISDFPDWVYLGQVYFSPMDANSYAVSLIYNQRIYVSEQGIFSIPDTITAPLIAFVHLLWIIIPFVLAYIFFRRREI